MDYIQEVEEFTENIFLIKLDTLVKGYDGKDIGYSNQQAQELANRTKWLKANLELLDKDTKQQISSIIETESNDIKILNEKLSTVVASITEVKKNVNSLSDILNKEIEKTNGISTDVSNLTKDVASVNKNLTEISDDLNNTNKNVENLNKKIGETDDNLDKTNGKVNTLIDTLDNTNAKVDTLTDGLDAANTKLNKLDEGVSSLSKDITAINKEITNVNKEIADLGENFNTTLSSVKEEINTSVDNKISAAKEELNGDISNLSKSVDEGLSALETEQKNLSASIKDTNEGLNKLNTQVVLKDETKTVFGETIIGTGDIALTTDVVANVIKAGSGIAISVKENALEISNTDPDDSTWELKNFDNAKKGEFYFYKAPEEASSGFMLHNLYRYFDNGSYKGNVVRKYEGSVLDNLIKNETLLSDEDGRIMCSEPYVVTADKKGTSNTYMVGLDVPKPDVDLTGMRIVVDQDALATVVNKLKSKADADYYGYKLFSVPVYSSGYDSWRLFSEPYAPENAVSAPTYSYWSGASYFYTYKTEVYIGITLDIPIYVQGYKIQCIDKFALKQSTMPKSWRFEGSTSKDSSNASWVVLDVQTNADLTLGRKESDGFRTFKLDGTEGIYTSFRIVITEVLNNAARPCLSRLNIIATSPLLLEDKTDRGEYYGFNEKNEIVHIANEDFLNIKRLLYVSGFYDTKLFKLTDIKNINKYNIVSNAQTKFSVLSYGKKIQLRLDPDIEKDVYATLCMNKFKVTAKSDAKLNAKIALVTDEKEWYVYKNGEWVELFVEPEKTYSYDAIASKVYASGMSINKFNAIPEADVIKFVSDLAGSSPSVSIAYAIYNTYASENTVPESLTIGYGSEIGWEPVDKDNIKIKFLNKRMIIEIVEDGNYKLLYNFFKGNF